MNSVGDGGTSWSSHALEPDSDVDSIAERVRTFVDDLSLMDACAELDLLAGRATMVAGSDCLLKVVSAMNGANDTRKFSKDTVARGIDDVA